jgi:hypothetical protein
LEREVINANDILAGKLIGKEPLGVPNRLQGYTEMDIKEHVFDVESKWLWFYIVPKGEL